MSHHQLASHEGATCEARSDLTVELCRLSSASCRRGGSDLLKSPPEESVGCDVRASKRRERVTSVSSDRPHAAEQ